MPTSAFEVGDPQGVGPVGFEDPVDQIASPGGVGILACGEDLAPPGHPDHPGRAHQPGGLIPADDDPGPPGRFPELLRPVDLAVGHPQRHQDLDHHRVADRPGTGTDLARLVGVVRARSHLQDPADGLDPELVTKEN